MTMGRAEWITLENYDDCFFARKKAVRLWRRRWRWWRWWWWWPSTISWQGCGAWQRSKCILKQNVLSWHGQACQRPETVIYIIIVITIAIITIIIIVSTLSLWTRSSCGKCQENSIVGDSGLSGFFSTQPFLTNRWIKKHSHIFHMFTQFTLP